VIVMSSKALAIFYLNYMQENTPKKALSQHALRSG
jgi:hypothetical protein